MIPVLLKDLLPRASLQQYVRKYQIFRFLFDRDKIPPTKFHAPRPEHCITFYPRAPQKFSHLNLAKILTYPQCIIGGIQTDPVYRYGGNDFLAIKVVLQPSVLYHLAKLPAGELTNTFINAEDLWGKDIRITCEKLSELDHLGEMMTVIETFIESRVNQTKKSSHPIDKVCQSMLQSEDPISLDGLANQSSLSVRQFIRKFEERMGVNPKMFSRLVRFNKAMLMKNKVPGLDWLSIAIACGYYDYQHLVIDFKEFTAHTPPSFFEHELKAPERTFGLRES